MRKPSQADAALDALAARVHDADVADDAAEAKAAFHLRMRARGIQDISVLRAFEIVPRQAFVPRRYLDLAQRDLALPIDCGQTLPEPWLVARLIEAAKVERKHRVLEIGAGTGYATAILSHLAADVISLERYQSLAIAAQARLDAQGIENAAVVWGDGLALPASLDPVDRIVVHGLLDPVPETLTDRLVEGGILVCARPSAAGQVVARLAKGAAGALTWTTLGPCSLQPILPGLAATL